MDLLGLRRGHDVGQAGVFREASQAGVLPAGGIRRDPGDGQWAGLRSQDHVRAGSFVVVNRR
ncbi:hypothetical protein ABZ434_30870 [Streptomyces sp. NPDC005761]|uniref:hypothetical protein n=1 Tax=unclassified Streptomyces TaxID=2593676 RepID=UPI0034040C09